MDSKKLEPFELLEAGRTDVIFAARQSRVNCDWTPLYYDAMYAILPEDYPVGGRELSHRGIRREGVPDALRAVRH